MVNKLPDTVAACNLIRSLRRNNKKYKSKTIRPHSITIDDMLISPALNINYYTPNGRLSLGHKLIIKGNHIYPTKNQRLKCINVHILNTLKSHRDLCYNAFKRQKDA